MVLERNETLTSEVDGNDESLCLLGSLPRLVVMEVPKVEEEEVVRTGVEDHVSE